MTETELIANAAYDRHMAKLDDPQAVLQAELEDQARFVNAYPLANVLMERPRLRLNYTIVFCAVVFILEIAGVLYGSGFLDRCIYGGRR